MLRAADVLAEARDGAEFGISASGLEFDIEGAAKHRDKVVKTLTGGVGGLMKKHKIEVVAGHRRAGREGAASPSTARTSRPARSCSRRARCSLPIPGTSFEGRVLDTAGMWL